MSGWGADIFVGLGLIAFIVVFGSLVGLWLDSRNSTDRDWLDD